MLLRSRMGSVLLVALTILVTCAVQGQPGGGSGGSGSGGAGAGGSGASGGGTGAGSPSQTPSAPKPAAGPASSPEVTEPAPSYGPLADYFAAKKSLDRTTGTLPRLNIDLTSQSVVAGPDYFTALVWRYDFGITQKLWSGAQADLNVRGGRGRDAGSILGSTQNTNQYGGTGSFGFILHLWVEQKLFDDQLTLRGGKMDLGDFIDVNRFGYYNFLGFSQNHNPAIEFPGNPLAAMLTYEPKNNPYYVSVGIANAEQSSFQSGIPDLTRGRTAPFAIGELGLKPTFYGQKGIYRFIGWYDGLRLAPINGGATSNSRYGLALDFDQNLTKDLGLFARYGWGEQNEFNPRQYWQVGFDWKGIVPGRPRDDLALAVAQNTFSSRRARTLINAFGSETYLEAYYNYVVYDWFQIQPFLQVLGNPAGTKQDPAVVLSVHLAFRF